VRKQEGIKIMTKEQVHEVFCKASNEDKTRLAVMCMMKGVDIRRFEENAAFIVTVTQKNIKKAMDYYRYLNGGDNNMQPYTYEQCGVPDLTNEEKSRIDKLYQEKNL
jgi:hypothetical protein